MDSKCGHFAKILILENFKVPTAVSNAIATCEWFWLVYIVLPYKLESQFPYTHQTFIYSKSFLKKEASY